MKKYKVGDIAALFPEPKEPTSEAGKKLQQLFSEFNSKKKAFQQPTSQNDIKTAKQKRNPELNETKKLNNNESENSRNYPRKKRKFSDIDNADSSINNMKEFKETYVQNVKSDFSKKKGSISSERDFPRKKRKFNESRNTSSSNAFYKFAKTEIDTENIVFDKSPESSNLKKDNKKHTKNNSSKENNDNVSFNSRMQKEDAVVNNGNRDFPRKKKKFSEHISAFSSDKKGFIKNKNFEEITVLHSSFESKGIKKSNKKHHVTKNNFNMEHNVSFGNSNLQNENNNASESSRDFPRNRKFTVGKNASSNNKGFIKYGKHTIFDESTVLGDSPKSKSSPPVTKKKHFVENNFSKEKSGSFTNSEEINASKSRSDFPRKKKKFTAGKNAPFSGNESFIKSKKHTIFDESSVLGTLPKSKFTKTPEKANKKLSLKTKNFSKEHDNVSFNNSTVQNKNINTDEICKIENEKNGNDIKQVKKLKKKKKKNLNKDSLPETSDDGTLKLEKTSFKSDEELLGRTLFVGNLPVDTKINVLRKLFDVFGPIEHVRIPRIESDKSKRSTQEFIKLHYAAESVPGFVTFEQRQSAVDALSLNGTVFKDHHITVDFASPPGVKNIYDDKRSVFIGNLPFDVLDESIWNAFSQCGSIEKVRVVRDRATGIGKGFGYIQFKTVKSQDDALALKEIEIQGRPIRIKPVSSNKKMQKSDISRPFKRDTFKSRAIKFKKSQEGVKGRKSIKKLMKKSKDLHKKKKIAAILQKSMKS